MARCETRWYQENDINAPSWVSGHCTAFGKEERHGG